MDVLTASKLYIETVFHGSAVAFNESFTSQNPVIQFMV